jgi:hypothetical protein
MGRFSYDEQLLQQWKSYPVRVVGPRDSRCCLKPTLLVQSMGGGFVSANCSECDSKQTLTQSEFTNLGLWVNCPNCRKRMLTWEDPHKNYAYQCAECQIFILLADILPHWEDLL